MTPRSPPGSKARPTAVLTGNPMDKYLDDSQEITVLYATSLDANHPPENVLKKDFTFWNTTGLYPQEITIALKEDTRIAEVKTVTANVKKISIQRVMPKKGPQGSPEWKEVTTSELPQTVDQLQVQSHRVRV